ncbi:MAG TPA: mechanosensitive ion channel family protein [Actinomycetota bacterium]|jgi:small conductance mechanosensitive channel|nr:mechanosensitive ion channel family protein [Actinomycetota bacterium]
MIPTHVGEVLLTRSLKVAAVLVVAFALDRVARWMVRRLVRSLQQQQVQQRLASIRARTPSALRSTEPLPSLRRSQRADALGALVRNLSSVLIWLIAGVLILQILGVQLGPLVAGAGFVGLAIAISAQQMVSDFLAGIAMLVEDEYGVGDVIDVGPATGEVERVGLRTTRLRAVDGTVWHVRNGEIDRVGNLSRDWRRVLLDVEVARGAELALATRTVEQAAQELYRDEQWRPWLLDEPEVWGVEGLGAGSATIRLALKTSPSRADQVARELRARVDEALERAGIHLPSTTEHP